MHLASIEMFHFYHAALNVTQGLGKFAAAFSHVVSALEFHGYVGQLPLCDVAVLNHYL